MKRTQHVVIIGAGPGGLAAAMLLAKSGVKVTIVEKRNHVGGRTATMQQDGYRFDIGPTFFLYPQVLREIFNAVGHNLDAEVPMQRLDPQYRLIFGAGGELLATPDPARMKQAIAQLSPQDAEAFDAFMVRNRKKLDRFKPFLQTPFERWSDLAKAEFLKLLPMVAPWRSLDDDLRRHFKDERIRLGFSFQSKYLGMSPFRCPSLFSILSFLEYEHGVFHPTGGCGAVTQAMAGIAREMGVTIHLDEPVEKVLLENGRARGVQTTTRRLDADAVIVNADFAEAMRKLVPNRVRHKWSDATIARKDFSCSTFMMYLGVEGRYDHVAHHTIYLADNYKENLKDIETRHCLTENPSFYVQNASVTDPTLAPDGHSTLYVLLPVTHLAKSKDGSMVDWSQQTRNFRQQALRQLEKIGITDLEQRIRTERIFTPSTWQSEFALFKGATFSMAHSLQQMLHLRPHNRFEDVEGMYLVGGGTHPGSGLPVIFESARITSRLLLEDLQVEPQWEPVSSAQTIHRQMLGVAS
ncbi:MAG: phytoene desaturase [Acidobacteriota bacterium]|nr:phytoene desaturase [Acidobacteriota bacterium]